MIDFRYHLVSLVSVFLALAVGIVLGAGPLKDPIGNSLTVSVHALQQQKDDLRDKLSTSEAGGQHRDEFVTAVTPSLVAGELTGRSVAILSLPGVQGSDVADSLNAAVKVAGGTVTSRVTIGGAWVDPAKSADRDKVVSDLAAALPIGIVPVAGTTDEKLAHLLSAALVSSTGARSTPNTATVLKSLSDANLIGIKGDLTDITDLAEVALVVAPANADADTNIKPTASPDVNASYLTLATALDTLSRGAVVIGPASAAIGDGVLAAIRKADPAKSEVSTVDTGETSMGVITAVLALREQLNGESGAYGFGSGTKILPALGTEVPGEIVPQPTATKK